MTSGAGKKDADLELYLLIDQLFRKPAWIVGDPEREGAIQFLAAYWNEDDPDKATAELLADLEKEPANRGFLVTVLQTQIELGLNDEFGALCAVDDWDDAEEE